MSAGPARLVALVGIFVAALAPAQFAHACGTSPGETVVIGEKTYVCLVINEQYYLVTQPTADTYTRVAVKDSFKSSAGDKFGPSAGSMARTTCPTDSLYTYGGNQGEQMCGYTTIHVESIGVKSFTKAYKIYDLSQPTTPKYAFNVLTAVISVNKGVVNSITWDDGCHFCSTISNVADGSNDFCVPNILVTNETIVDSAATVSLAQEYAQEGAFPLSEQRLTELKFDGYGKNCAMYGDKNSGAAGDCTTDDGAVCDLKLYIVWTGTDKNGQYFQSAGLRFSRFKMFSVSTLYSSARSLSLDAYSGAESTANNVADSVSSRL